MLQADEALCQLWLKSPHSSGPKFCPYGGLATVAADYRKMESVGEMEAIPAEKQLAKK